MKWPIFHCKQTWSNKIQGEWTSLESADPHMAARRFAEENNLEDGELVSVRGSGTYKIRIEMEPEYYADKVTK